jgi:protease I
MTAASKKVAFLMGSGFEDSEFKLPYTALQQAGAQISLLGAHMDEDLQGKRGQVTVSVDATFTEVRCEDFDALVIPGGSAPDKIRTHPYVESLIIDAMAQGKLIAAVCHGPQILIEADQLRGKHATGYRSIRKDMQNAGAIFLDQPVVVEGNLITSRQPSDLPLFTTVLLSHLDLSLADLELPEIDREGFEWWKLGEKWGGSSRTDILNALNRAIAGEHYTWSAFREYDRKASDLDTELHTVLREVMTTKQRHIQLLEVRLRDFNETVTWQATGSEAFAALLSWLQSNDDEIMILRRALGDLQTGIRDAHDLCVRLTDPRTGELLDEIHANLRLHEQRLSDLYRARQGSQVSPPIPTGALI